MIICHSTRLLEEIRAYDSIDGYENRDPFLAIVTIVWHSDTKVQLRGAEGRSVSRGMLIACFTLLFNAGAELITLTRASGRKMPFARLVGIGEKENTWEIDLLRLRGECII